MPLINKDLQLEIKKQSIIHKINFMANETSNYMAKIILEQNLGIDYANRVEVDSIKFKVKFFLFSSKTNLTSCVEMSFQKLATICSNKANMLRTFDKIAFQMLDAVNNKNKILLHAKNIDE